MIIAFRPAPRSIRSTASLSGFAAGRQAHRSVNRAQEDSALQWIERIAGLAIDGDDARFHTVEFQRTEAGIRRTNDTEAQPCAGLRCHSIGAGGAVDHLRIAETAGRATSTAASKRWSSAPSGCRRASSSVTITSVSKTVALPRRRSTDHKGPVRVDWRNGPARVIDTRKRRHRWFAGVKAGSRLVQSLPG